MQTILLNTGSGSCKISVGAKLHDIKSWISSSRFVIITDRNVSHFYKDSFPEGPLIEIEPGEKSKTLDTAQSVYGQLLDSGLDRKDFILAVGGGVVCDLAGFVASTYLRGLRFGFVASSLLAQVDAAIGGKNGVDFRGFKNIIGVIKQPEFVLCDPDLLKTLDRKEFIGGLSEVIKYGAIMDYDFFTYCEDHIRDILSMDTGIMHEVVFRSAGNKVKLVEQDEFESGERMKLNFGHTFAHALEAVTGITHGEAVAIGMNMAAEISVKEKLLQEKDAARLKLLIMEAGLPVSADVDPQKLIQAIGKDKKKRGSSVGLILLEELGKSVIHYMDMDRLSNVINDLYRHRI